MAEKAYGIRTDLNQPQAKVRRMVAKNQTYGKATEQNESQKAVPMGSPPEVVRANQRARVKPEPLPPLFRSTERPDQPITAGAPFGPGANPIAAGIPMFDPKAAALEELKILAQIEQNDDLADLASRWMS